MLTFTQFIIESEELPFDHNPHIGAWRESMEKDGHVTVYHGTHKRNVSSILKNGLSHKDPKTGMISVSHCPHTAHGYAAMSGAGGESDFRKKGKPVNTPHEDRAVVKMRIPKHFIEKHMDHDLSGNERSKDNPNVTKMHDSSTFHKWKKENPTTPDHHFYQVSELRLKKEVPAKYIVGHMFKKKK